MASVKLNINGKTVLSTQVTYDDLVILYQQFIAKHDRVPSTAECTAANNLPQGRIIKRVLKEADVTYNDFLVQFGTKCRIRTENTDKYNFFVQKFVAECQRRGKTLSESDLFNNKFGIPSSTWLTKNCPDKSVKTYTDFIKWCGLEPLRKVWTKEEVAVALKDLEKRLGRPVQRYDIIPANVGFSTIVIQRLYGSINKAKAEIGLIKTPTSLPLHDFSYYKDTIDQIIDNYIKAIGDKRMCHISWSDIESGKYGARCEHKTLVKAFMREGIDFYAYIKSKGCMINKSLKSFCYTMDSGENVRSGYEYALSAFLNSLGYLYNKDYFRDKKYSTFTNYATGRLNCDYELHLHNGQILYIEVAGMIHKPQDGNWREHLYGSDIEMAYRDKMILKDFVLNDNDLEHVFLFANEMSDGSYRDILRSFLRNAA